MQMRIKASHVLIVFITGWCFHQCIYLVSIHMHSKLCQISSSTSTAHTTHPWFIWWGLVMWTEQTCHDLPSSPSPAQRPSSLFFCSWKSSCCDLYWWDIFVLARKSDHVICVRLLLKLHTGSSGRNMEAAGSKMIMFHHQTEIRWSRADSACVKGALQQNVPVSHSPKTVPWWMYSNHQWTKQP